MKIDMKAKGLKSSKRLLREAGELAATCRSADFLGQPRREPDPEAEDNAQVFSELADRGRALLGGAADSEAGDAGCEAWLAEIERRLQEIAHGIGSESSAVRRAVAGAAMRKMVAGILGIIVDRAERNVDWQGRYKPVNQGYAAERRERYGVPENVVYRATGQLLANLQPTNASIANVRLHYRK